MNVARKELSQELSALSGWEDTYWKHCAFQNHSSPEGQRSLVHNTIETTADALELVDRSFVYQLEMEPAYDLGYLREKICEHTPANATDVIESNFMTALFHGEDATVQFAIDLFKQNILTKKGAGNGNNTPA